MLCEGGCVMQVREPPVSRLYFPGAAELGPQSHCSPRRVFRTGVYVTWVGTVCVGLRAFRRVCPGVVVCGDLPWPCGCFRPGEGGHVTSAG